jgi:nitrogen fixation NifU-like protein
MDFSQLDNRFIRHVNLPDHMGSLTDPSGRARGVGPCGDSVEFTLRVAGDRIAEIRHLPRGCAFTIACANAACELACGRTLESALEISPEDVERELGGLPADHRHCARLAVNTLGEAVADCYRTPRRPPEFPPQKEAEPDAHLRH